MDPHHAKIGLMPFNPVFQEQPCLLTRPNKKLSVFADMEAPNQPAQIRRLVWNYAGLYRIHFIFA
ncbi:hypothetical protein DPMN_025228 [Dreissena polymorpha]|uniref:Uncharacterized protein n=1 Tax=Dreissena polymorpha TaxID=45954 RepID=A0A9D4RD52_DREPO|nr:hypothetical protein DPMN_025228 [Dreissena polymorpha]